MSQVQEEVSSPPNFWVRLVLFPACALGALLLLNVGLSAVGTLKQLDAIETERDKWQHPTQVIEALNLRRGNAVDDIGCGSGYFSLKLSDRVGANGRVIAEDIRRLPLAFLWVRAARNGKHHVTVHLGNLEDPRLDPNSLNAVLISNTYHEFSAPLNILDHVRQALLPGGKIVIIDRTPRPATGQTAMQEHEVASGQVETDLLRPGFAIDVRTDNFIDKDPED
jgi:ubiquinone/menaquinone biosynthesis C-methylase UbiE